MEPGQGLNMAGERFYVFARFSRSRFCSAPWARSEMVGCGALKHTDTLWDLTYLYAAEPVMVRGGTAIYALWQPGIRTEDPRATWQNGYGAWLVCRLVIAVGFALAATQGALDLIQWIGLPSPSWLPPCLWFRANAARH